MTWRVTSVTEKDGILFANMTAHAPGTLTEKVRLTGGILNPLLVVCGINNPQLLRGKEFHGSSARSALTRRLSN